MSYNVNDIIGSYAPDGNFLELYRITGHYNKKRFVCRDLLYDKEVLRRKDRITRYTKINGHPKVIEKRVEDGI